MSNASPTPISIPWNAGATCPEQMYTHGRSASWFALRTWLKRPQRIRWISKRFVVASILSNASATQPYGTTPSSTAFATSDFFLGLDCTCTRLPPLLSSLTTTFFAFNSSRSSSRLRLSEDSSACFLVKMDGVVVALASATFLAVSVGAFELLLLRLFFSVVSLFLSLLLLLFSILFALSVLTFPADLAPPRPLAKKLRMSMLA
mmetsp:Transcript_12459/g.24179  ORF Transcript_12459/g.24179 Transcript_12459/m.24179 type:complete len:204 (+) Transcript_12459:1990-2601(+)